MTCRSSADTQNVVGELVPYVVSGPKAQLAVLPPKPVFIFKAVLVILSTLLGSVSPAFVSEPPAVAVVLTQEELVQGQRLQCSKCPVLRPCPL